jgi:hypothetical protein
VRPCWAHQEKRLPKKPFRWRSRCQRGISRARHP